MTFSDLIAAADRAIGAAMGNEIVYLPAVGPPTTVVGVFDELYVLATGDPEAGVSVIGPAVFLRLDDLPVNPELDEPRVQVAGSTYRVVERKPDGLGGIVLALRRVT